MEYYRAASLLHTINNPSDLNKRTMVALLSGDGAEAVANYCCPVEQSATFAGRETVTPLSCAAQCGNADACAALIDAGAEIDLTDGAGRTPLCAAIDAGEVAIVEDLLEKGADATKESQGELPVARATRLGLAEEKRVVECLVSHGASTVDVAAKPAAGDSVAADKIAELAAEPEPAKGDEGACCQTM